MGELLNNDLTAMSNSSGTAFPVTNLQIGMFCYRLDTQTLYQLEALTPTWIPIWCLASGNCVSPLTGSYSGFIEITSSTILPAARRGRRFNAPPPHRSRLNRPWRKLLFPGASIAFFNNGTSTVTLTGQGNDFICDQPAFGASNTSIVLSPGDSAILTTQALGVNQWNLTGGSVAIFKTASAAFTGNVTFGLIPTAPSPAVGDSSLNLVNSAWVNR